MEWGLVVPVKSLVAAKSRFGGRTSGERADLARAFAMDTVLAASAAPGVAAVVVVTGDPAVSDTLLPLGVRVVGDDHEPDLNTALQVGAAALRGSRPELGVTALVADLPALRADDLTAALRRAAAWPAAYVADRSGTGTTLVTAAPGQDLVVRFGTGSARHHEETGHVAVLGDLTTLRCDVDSEEDLEEALRLGVGRATTEACARWPRRGGAPGS